MKQSFYYQDTILTTVTEITEKNHVIICGIALVGWDSN
jgi:hypothetical protein